MIDLKKARAICDDATSGPWSRIGQDVRKHYQGYDHRMAYASTEFNATFIAFARTALPEAIEEIERLREAGNAEGILRMSNESFRKKLAEKDAIISNLYHETLKPAEKVDEELDDLRKRLELAEAVCKITDAVHGEHRTSKDTCSISIALQAWREGIK